MIATPAWPPRSLPRLFVRAALADDATVALDPAQANYLGNVLRLGAGGEVLLFDGASGEWLARITEAAKKRMTVTVQRRTRSPETLPELTLAFAPIKRAQTDWLVEKATELGVARLQPVMTGRTVAERVKLERLESIAIEAAEQCGRTLLPAVAEPKPLAAFLGQLDRPLYFADETGGAHASEALRPGPATILIGPEGGFTPDEREAVRAHRLATAISLGPRILRAETAALAAVTAYMALAGDWR
ncbi:16S rRNA (uracil(1498)-N(3))-methyltransferase [Sphingomonas sp. BN140010]|uniref:Ribosomal RNA small subunit methyltransferase E n=1 Tax=Sphingomonas arvum TaxID=2992113 RepID=A0ABT3JBK3_9SPHN|nr:16S rRNA (uracil(1498)-N(3))-methyltransferase [Sphingomonas sp. BN140010]MCW3796453.1 16S rRNA (uracil(1498)-N(3))-methyltransferase [Sphingomonas sp. BN140010]